MITAQAPGKLYIAGEYAVVESGYPAIIIALDQFVTCTVEEGTEFGSIFSSQYSENSLQWRRNGDKMVFDNRDNPFHYILSAIKITEEYTRDLGIDLKLYHLKIDSQLDSADGKKYGLGSSAAVTVATVKALLAFYEINASQDTVFKLSAIAHFEVQGNGSLGDIAASVYGGWIAYNSFDRQWLAQQRRVFGLADILQLPWPSLNIEQLTPPANLKLLIGWTGSPASTSKLVDKVSLAKAKESIEYQEFLTGSRQCLTNMINGFRTGNLEMIQREIRQNRSLLRSLAEFSGVAIETPILTKLCDIAEHFGGAAKTSGAGGGDCGIVLVDKLKDSTKLLNEWTAAKVEQLNLAVHNIRVSQEER